MCREKLVQHRLVLRGRRRTELARGGVERPEDQRRIGPVELGRAQAERQSQEGAQRHGHQEQQPVTVEGLAITWIHRCFVPYETAGPSTEPASFLSELIVCLAYRESDTRLLVRFARQLRLQKRFLADFAREIGRAH